MASYLHEYSGETDKKCIYYCIFYGMLEDGIASLKGIRKSKGDQKKTIVIMNSFNLIF